MFIFRHGETTYSQGKVTIAEAHDLTPQGIDTTLTSAESLYQLLEESFPVTAWSSPYGRALHTALLCMDLVIGDFQTTVGEDAESSITICDSLEEVLQFNYQLFVCLVNGGTFQGYTFNPCETNPDRISVESYFLTDRASQIPELVKSSWPVEIRTAVEAMESCEHATCRMHRFLRGLMQTSEQTQHILFTHDGLLTLMVAEATDWKYLTLERGKFVRLSWMDDDLAVSYIEGRTIANHHRPIFATARDRYGADYLERT